MTFAPIAIVTSGLIRKRSRSEEHTSELQSRLHLVCRLLLEKKKDYDTLEQQLTHNLGAAVNLEPLAEFTYGAHRARCLYPWHVTPARYASFRPTDAPLRTAR